MRTTYAFDATNLAELDRFLRLEIIGEQSQGMDKGRTARIATAYVFDGEDMARRVAREWGGDAAQAVADRVITFMEAIRTERSRYWKVGFDLHGKHFEGTAMDNALTVRAQHEWVERRAGATGVQITEYTATLTSAVADADRLPRDESHQAPDVPGAQEVHRFYRFDGVVRPCCRTLPPSSAPASGCDSTGRAGTRCPCCCWTPCAQSSPARSTTTR